MKLRHLLLAVLLASTFLSCDKENENIISYNFIGHEWTLEKSDINALLYNNILELKFYSENQFDVYGALHFTIHNPSIGIFNINDESRHGFSYYNLTTASLVDFLNRDQKGTIEITKLDKVSKTISFKANFTLSNANFSNEPLEILAENVPMNVVNKSANYVRCLRNDAYQMVVDTISENQNGYFGASNFGLRIYCYSTETYKTGTYTQEDKAIMFYAGQLLLSQNTPEYTLTILATNNNPGLIIGTFDARSVYTDLPEEFDELKNGYFELFSDR